MASDRSRPPRECQPCSGGRRSRGPDVVADDQIYRGPRLPEVIEFVSQPWPILGTGAPFGTAWVSGRHDEVQDATRPRPWSVSPPCEVTRGSSSCRRYRAKRVRTTPWTAALIRKPRGIGHLRYDAALCPAYSPLLSACVRNVQRKRLPCPSAAREGRLGRRVCTQVVSQAERLLPRPVCQPFGCQLETPLRVGNRA